MIPDNIRKLRKKNHMSQDELAEKLGVSRQSVSLWENGQTQPTIENIIALAKVFNVSSDVILMESDAGDTSADASAAPAVPTIQPIIQPAVYAPAEPAPQEKKSAPVWPIILVALALLLICAALYYELVMKENGSLWGGASSAPADISASSTGAAISQGGQGGSGQQSGSDQQGGSGQQGGGTVQKKDIFEECKKFAIENGHLNGDYSMYQQSAGKYGGRDNEYFSVSYWGDTDKVEFCLHCPLSETFSINFYIRMRGGYNGKYEYCTSKYYRDTGKSYRSAYGYIDPAVFSRNYPLNCSEYNGPTDGQDDFMEESRVGICDLIDLIGVFVRTENTGLSFSDFEFVNFG